MYAPILIETERLCIRSYVLADAPFIRTLLNTPSWLEFIGDRGVITVADAETYIVNNALMSYEQHGFGPYIVELKETGLSIGHCGLHKRPALDDIDIGFAFLPEHAGCGYGYESAAALVAYAQNTLGLARLTGITKPTNNRSIRLLEKLGMRFEKQIAFRTDAPKSLLFGMALPAMPNIR